MGAVDDGLREGKGELCGLGFVLNGVEDMGSVRAYELFCAVDDHLRRVDIREMKGDAVLALAFGEERGGEAVSPAEVVPVIDVLAEHDDVGGLDWLELAEFGQQSVGRRATGAAFGGEELDEYGRWRCGLGTGGRKKDSRQDEKRGAGDQRARPRLMVHEAPSWYGR